jgi:hypothetical protein
MHIMTDYARTHGGTLDGFNPTMLDQRIGTYATRAVKTCCSEESCECVVFGLYDDYEYAPKYMYLIPEPPQPSPPVPAPLPDHRGCGRRASGSCSCPTTRRP